MKRFLMFCAVGLISLAAATVSAQTRGFSAGTVVNIDDGAGHTVSIEPPAGITSSYVWSLPIVPAPNTPSGFINVGTATGQLPYWDNSGTGQWSHTTDLLWDEVANALAITGTLSATGTITGGSSITLGDDAATPTAGSIILNDATGSNTYTGTLKTPTALTASQTYTLPDASGTLALTSQLTGGLSHITEAFATTGDYTPTNASEQLQATGATNVSISLTPAGTGALQVQPAGLTAAGGNLRGTNAVDWQINRTDPENVASGNYSVISGGSDNLASGTNSTVAGGLNNHATELSATVAGGSSNIASGQDAIVAGGTMNQATATQSAVLGGNAGTADGLQSTVVGGYQNHASGQHTAVVGGLFNLAAGESSTVVAGNNLTTNGYTQIAWGQYNTIMPTSAAVFYNATDPAWIVGNGSGTATADRSYSMYGTFDSKLVLGGRATSSDATGGQSKTGAIKFGTANNTTFATLTSASQAADRTYTIPDAGANANVVLTEGNKTINGNITYGGLQAVSFAHGTYSSGTLAMSATRIYVLDDNGISDSPALSLPTGTIIGQVQQVSNHDANAATVSIGSFTVRIPSGATSTFVFDGTNWH